MKVEYTEALKKTSTILIDSAEKRLLKKAVLSKSSDRTVTRATITLKSISGRDMFQIEKLCTDNKALHSNFEIYDLSEILQTLSEFSQINIICYCGEAEYRCSKSKNDTVIGYDKLMRAINESEVNRQVSLKGNNKEKKYILNGSESFL